MRIWGNDGANRGGLRRKLRAEQERERKLVLRHRWYAGGVATLISAALVFTGVSTPALADVVPPPAEDTSQATTPPTDTPPAETPPAVETPPVDAAVPPADTTTPPADTTTPPAETTPTDAPTAPAEPKTDQTQSRQAVDELVVTPLAVGPDGATPPYVYWRALDQNASPLAGATFYLQGPRESGGFSDSSNSRWDANEATVTDCVVAPCAGPDLDSDPGEFLVKTFDGHTVTATNRYRVQQTAAPAGYIPTTLNTYRFIPGSGATPTTSPWTGSTYSFGDFLHTVPVPGTVTIQKGGLRTGAQAVGGLAGATFDVYKGGTATTPDTAAANLVGSCVTAANGQCSVPVPAGAEYWIIERSAPSGWSMIDQLYVGGSDGSQTNTPYRFRTGSVSAGSNTTYPVVGTGSGATTSSGYWADVKNNPAALQACGIRVGLLVDLSNSIDSTELTQLKNAANGFVDALQGTPSTLAMWTFATNAPANGANNGSLGLTSVSTPAGATIVKNKISGLTQPGGDQGGTNWDQGLWQVANDAANKVDVLLMLTDGTPTFYGPSADGPGSYSRFREVESAVFSANAVKQLGTRVVPVGIGVGNAVANIKAISGPAVNSDYYLVDNYAALAAFLQNLAKGQCDSTINVTKLVQPAGGGTATATPGWGFTATSNNAVTPGAGNTNASGAISFKVAGLTAGQSAAVNITEENRAGYTLVKQGGLNAVCKDETGAAVTVTNNGALGFTANATGGKIVSCTVINQAPNPQVKLQVIKKWVINNTPYENNDPNRPFGSAALTLNTAPATFGNEYTYNVGDSVAIAETVTGLPTFCTNVSSGTGTHVMTSTPTPNVVTVTNTVTCSTQLKLTKKVANGETSATTWNLLGTGPGGALAGPTGNGPTTALTNVTPAARYVLSETGTDLRYTQEVAPNAVPVAGSSGSWHCYILDAQGNRVSEGAGGLNGWVEVQLGQHVDCEAINQTAQLTILKHVVNDNGGTAEADDWTLSATPKPVLAGLAPITGVVGAEGATTANTKYVRPGYTYTINETGPAQGYTKVRLERLVNGAWVEVVGFDVSVTALGHETYRIVNDDVAPKLTLIKSVTNDNGGNAQPTAWTLTASTPGGPNLSGTTGVNGTVEAGEVYTIAENSGPSGYTWDSLSCTGYPNTTKAAPTLTLKPGDDVTCTLVNNDQPGSLTLVKVVDNANGGTAVATDWNGNLHAKRGADTTLNYNTGEAKQVAAGTYTLSETGQLAGYTLTNLVCSTGGTTLANNTVAVANGATVTCTFTNTAQQPTLTLEKQVVNTGGGISTADAWTLKATAGANSPINGIGSPAGGLVASISGSVLGDTTYTLTESGPSGYTSTGVWACVVTGTSTLVPVTNSNQVKTTVGQNVTCRIVNTAVPGTAQIAKVAGTPVQNADGTWTIPYTITVTNTSAASTVTYNLTDTLSFGAGITVNSASWTGPDASGGNFTGSNATMATGKQLTKATLTHVYHVTANASIASGVPAGTTWQCSATDPKRAFRNTTTMTVGGTPTTVDACSEPSFPDVTKVAGTPTQNSDASWNISYTITVKNPGAVPISATLTDAFPATPAGWTLAGGVWNIAAQSGAPILNNTSAASPIWSGTLPANTTYTYLVTGKLTPTASATPIGSCQTQGKGLTNTATVTSGSVSDTSGDCVSIVTPPVTVVKTDGTVSQLANGTWQIDYTITVNNGGTQASVYTLTDTPDLGTGFTLVSGAWVGTAPVANTAIEGNGSDQYVYRVVASFNAATPNPELTCDTTNGGAFFNTALVTFPGGTDDDTGCGEPKSPTVTKSAAAATQAPGGEWTLTYTVTVTNASGIPLAYTASDTPAALPAGVTLTTPWSVTGPAALNGGTAALTAGWTGAAPTTQFATGHLLAGTTHTYTVKAGVTLTVGVNPATLTCGQTPGGNGFWNNATVTNGVGGSSANACTSITTTPVNIVKSDGTASQAAGGVWTIDYTVTVTNASPTIATVYSLTDTPQFDSSFTILTQGWLGNPDVTDIGIEGGGSDTYHYVVTAEANETPVDPTALVCSSTGKGGFFNSATVTYPGGTASDTGCAVPAKPVVQKTAQASVQNTATGEWTLTYKVAVSNPTQLALSYTVSDTAAALPAGVTGGAWAASNPDIVVGGTYVRNAAWAGSGQLAAGTLPVGAVHTYTVTRTVTVASTVTDAALTCGEVPNQGGGVWNTATVTNGLANDNSSDCAEIDRPDVTITKTETGTTQLVDGTWTITYDVVVTNESTTLAATYNLSDTLMFGGDIVVDDASWTGPTGSDQQFTAGTATLATNRVLAPKAGDAGVDTYTVTVHATVDQAAWSGDTLECKEGERPAAGGFLNTALVTVNGGTIPADDCSEPKLPTIDKVGVSAAQDPVDPAKWLVSYDVTVTSGGYATFYSLSDTPDFQTGITLGAGSAQRTDIPAQPTVSITSGAEFATDVALPANATHTYRVSWIATVTDAFTFNEETCTGEPGDGFFNKATLTVGDIPIDGTDCIPVADRVYPTITKTVTSTVQKPDSGDWVITYNLEVKLAAKGPDSNPDGLSAKYDLTDTLDFGGDINIGNASWTGTSSGDFVGDNATMATNKTIAAGATHTYTVRVLAEVTKKAIDTGTTTCKEGSPPAAGGFLNTALLKSGGKSTPVDACSEPVFPDVEKTAVGDAELDPETGLWRVTYKITVKYPTTDADPRPSLAYVLTDKPVLPAGVTLDGDWTASAAGDDTPTPDDATWDGTGDWTIIASTLDPEANDITKHVFTVTAQVRVAAAAATAKPCGEGEVAGIAVWNNAIVTSGAYVNDDDACQNVHFDDVGIVKTTQGVDGPVESDGTFKYVLTVKNHGTRAATNVKVSDPVPGRLTVTGIDFANAPGWSNDHLPLFVGEGNTVNLTGPASFGVGATAEIVLTVKVNPVPVPEIPNLNEGDPVPTPELPQSTLVNQACVDADVDSDPSNDCDSVTVETKDIAAIVYTRCVGDAPLIGFVVAKTPNLAALPVDFTWTPKFPQSGTAPANVQKTYPGGTATVSDEFAWVGTAFTPSGISIDYPGWRGLTAADYAAGGGYYIPGTTDVMTPADEEEMIFNGLIFDPSELDYAWRNTTTVVLSVNPSMTFEVAYPDATPECFVARHTEVQIEKTASVEKTEPGKSFTYTLAAANVSDDSAADGVVVTDTIPADLKITDVSWTGKGDANTFPNWSSCAVAGQNGAGYGGTLTCELFGPLQPAGSGLGASAAPTITLSATVNASSKASVITNVGVVDYYTFGDPTDTGRDADDAVVLLSGLPATGGSALTPLILLGFLALLGGTMTVFMIRRRRGDPKPQL